MIMKKWTHICNCQLCIKGMVLKSSRGVDIENTVKYLYRFMSARWLQKKKKTNKK